MKMNYSAPEIKVEELDKTDILLKSDEGDNITIGGRAGGDLISFMFGV